MAYLGYLLLALVVLAAAMQWRIATKATAQERHLAPDLEPAIDDKLRERGRVLLNFFSPSCGPCHPKWPPAAITTASDLQHGASDALLAELARRRACRPRAQGAPSAPAHDRRPAHARPRG